MSGAELGEWLARLPPWSGWAVALVSVTAIILQWWHNRIHLAVIPTNLEWWKAESYTGTVVQVYVRITNRGRIRAGVKDAKLGLPDLFQHALVLDKILIEPGARDDTALEPGEDKGFNFQFESRQPLALDLKKAVLTIEPARGKAMPIDIQFGMKPSARETGNKWRPE